MNTFLNKFSKFYINMILFLFKCYSDKSPFQSALIS